MKLQLVLAFMLIGMIPMTAFLKVGSSTYETQALDQRISELKYHANIISNLILNSLFLTTGDSASSTDIDSEISQVADVYKGRIIIVDEDLCILKDTYGLEEGKTLISEEAVKGIQGESSSYIDRENEYVELVLPIVKPSTKETQGLMIMSFSISNIFEVKDSFMARMGLIAAFFAVFIMIAAILFMLYFTRPWEKMVVSVERLSEGYFDEQLEEKGFSETMNVAKAINEMLNKIQKLENSRQEFVSNVSHELKTPITSMKVLSDSLINQPDVPVELYREFMTDIGEEIERENKIINDLLSLVKMDKTAGEMNIASVDINELLEMILKRLRPIAQKRNIELVFESFRPVTAEVDEVKLSLAINNLIENAIKYNYDDGWVRVTLNADHKFFYVKVADSGVGIPEEAQDNIFERFYRVDKAHSRETGGTGLGLSITRNAILMHRGAIKVYSKEKEGTTFTVRVPLNYIL
jgi:signal transduction histidine kinase